MGQSLPHNPERNLVGFELLSRLNFEEGNENFLTVKAPSLGDVVCDFAVANMHTVPVALGLSSKVVSPVDLGLIVEARVHDVLELLKAHQVVVDVVVRVLLHIGDHENTFDVIQVEVLFSLIFDVEFKSCGELMDVNETRFVGISILEHPSGFGSTIVVA